MIVFVGQSSAVTTVNTCDLLFDPHVVCLLWFDCFRILFTMYSQFCLFLPVVQCLVEVKKYIYIFLIIRTYVVHLSLQTYIAIYSCKQSVLSVPCLDCSRINHDESDPMGSAPGAVLPAHGLCGPDWAGCNL